MWIWLFLSTCIKLIPHRQQQLSAIQISCPEPHYQPNYSIPLVPPHHSILPPYIIHIQSDRNYNNVSELIHHETKIPYEYITSLVEFGSIYIQLKNKPERYIPTHKLLKSIIPVGTYCRVHVNPRRYPDVYKYSNQQILQQHVLHNYNDFIVFDKPRGSIPTSSTVDNNRENIVSMMESCLNVKQLYVTGRLDACTSGTNYMYIVIKSVL
jgi:hypothetical protein